MFEDWTRRTGKPILDGIGSTEMLHIFITSRIGDALPGADRAAGCGYEAKVVDADMNDVPAGTIGRLAVRGPTGCRYLSDKRQIDYVRDGWNLTGDAFVQDVNGRVPFRCAQRRHDCLGGLQRPGPEVEAARWRTRDVAECAVIGAADANVGRSSSAFVVLKAGVVGDNFRSRFCRIMSRRPLRPINICA